MSLTDLLFIPALFGLIGFLEPCSLGINSLFLAHLQKQNPLKKASAVLQFTLIRATVLGLLGLSIVWLGQKFFTFQIGYFQGLGIFYIALGILAIASQKFALMKSWDLGTKLIRQKTVHLGLVFGLTIPACAIPLLLAIAAKTTATGDLLAGFVSLFIFGIFLSLPLFFFAHSQHGFKLIQKIHAKLSALPYLVGGLLIFVGLVTIWSARWWVNLTL